MTLKEATLATVFDNHRTTAEIHRHRGESHGKEQDRSLELASQADQGRAQRPIWVPNYSQSPLLRQ